MIKLLVAAIFINLVSVGAFKKCCQGINEITSPGRKCPDGKPLDISPCQSYILPKNETDTTIDEHDNLVIEYDTFLPPDE